MRRICFQSKTKFHAEHLWNPISWFSQQHRFKASWSRLLIQYIFILCHILTLWGDKAGMLTYVYPHKPLRKIEVIICNHQVAIECPLYVWPDVWSSDLQSDKSMVIHDTESPHWDQVSINNINLNLFKMFLCWILPIFMAQIQSEYGHKFM